MNEAPAQAAQKASPISAADGEGRNMGKKGTSPFVVGFVGRSGVGKTTFAERVVASLAAKGHRVAVLKDAHHGFDMDKPGKDSWRYREAGAAAVIVRSDKRWAFLKETEAREPVERLLAFLPECDFVVVEGFKHEGTFPKIEVRRAGASLEPPLAGEIETLAAVVTDFDEPEFPRTLPRLDLSDPDGAADFIVNLRNNFHD